MTSRLSGHPQQHPWVPGWVEVPTEPLTQQEVGQPQGHVEGGEEQVGAGLGRLRHVLVETHSEVAQGLGHRRPLRPRGLPAGLGGVLVAGARRGACAQGAEGILGGPGGSSCRAPAGGGPGLLGCWPWLLGVQGLLALEGDVQGGLLLGAGRRWGRRPHVPQRGWGGTWGRCLRRAQAQRAGRSLQCGDLGTGTPVRAGRGHPGVGSPRHWATLTGVTVAEAAATTHSRDRQNLAVAILLGKHWSRPRRAPHAPTPAPVPTNHAPQPPRAPCPTSPSSPGCWRRPPQSHLGARGVLPECPAGRWGELAGRSPAWLKIKEGGRPGRLPVNQPRQREGAGGAEGWAWRGHPR